MSNNLKAILSVTRGKCAWSRLSSRENIKREQYVIICLKKERKLTKCYMANFQTVMKKKRMDAPIILTDDTEIFNEYGHGSEYSVIYMDSKKLNDIVKYYLFKEFKERIVIVSLDEPFGSNGLIDAGKVCIEDMLMNYIW